MWLLVSEHETDASMRGKSIPLLLDHPKYVVGRDTASEVCLCDASVSRKHAILYPTADYVKLEDEKSSVGTYINGSHLNVSRIPKDAHSFLRFDDYVIFGGKGNKWRLTRIDISVMTTKLDPRDSLELKTILRSLNGNLVTSAWSNSVTHLVTQHIHFTPKLLLALVNCVPLVNLDFFRDAAKVVKETSKLPDETEYVPALLDNPEEDDFDFAVDERRKTLFQDLSFIFVEQDHMSAFQKIVELAGGKVTLWDKKKTPATYRVASVVIGDPTGAGNKDLSDFLLKRGRRLIPDKEIALSIAVVSREKYCNPKYHPGVGKLLSLATPCLEDDDNSDVELIADKEEEVILLDTDEEWDQPSPNKSSLRPGFSGEPPVSNTEIPETAAPMPNANSIDFPDDDEDDFVERSQQILQIVDQHSSPAVTSQQRSKRKLSKGSEEESSPPVMKRANSQLGSSAMSGTATEKLSLFASKSDSQMTRFNTGEFISRPSQKQHSPTESTSNPTAAISQPTTTNKTKRTLADLMSKDDSDSEEEMTAFRKKKKETRKEAVVKSLPPPVASSTKTQTQTPVPSLRPVEDPAKVSAVDDKSVLNSKPIRISQLSGWLSKSFNTSCSIKSETPLDESKAWVTPLLNSCQVKEILVDVTNLSRNRTNNTTNSVRETTADWSSRKNFKSFKKQTFTKSPHDADFIRTKTVLITEKL